MVQVWRPSYHSKQHEAALRRHRYHLLVKRRALANSKSRHRKRNHLEQRHGLAGVHRDALPSRNHILASFERTVEEGKKTEERFEVDRENAVVEI